MTSEIQQRIIDEAYLELVKFTIKDWKLVPTERCRICRDGVHDPPIEYDVEFKTKNVYRGGFLNDEKKLQGKGKFRSTHVTFNLLNYCENLLHLQMAKSYQIPRRVSRQSDNRLWANDM